MAVRAYYVSNPTGADITTNAKTAKARRITSLNFDDAALANGWTDLVVFLAGGCTVVSSQATFEQRQQGGEIQQVEEQDIIGAGGLA
jgi:hypothetical protein